MAKALWQQAAHEAERQDRKVEWAKRMSDHIAYALLIYTGVNIFVTMGALKSHHGTILPYFGLVFLVAAIIPACRLLERRWEGLASSDASDGELRGLYTRDRLIVWAAALGLPLFVTAIVKGIVALT